MQLGVRGSMAERSCNLQWISTRVSCRSQHLVLPQAAAIDHLSSTCLTFDWDALISSPTMRPPTCSKLMSSFGLGAFNASPWCFNLLLPQVKPGTAGPTTVSRSKRVQDVQGLRAVKAMLLRFLCSAHLTLLSSPLRIPYCINLQCGSSPPPCPATLVEILRRYYRHHGHAERRSHRLAGCS